MLVLCTFKYFASQIFYWIYLFQYHFWFVPLILSCICYQQSELQLKQANNWIKQNSKLTINLLMTRFSSSNTWIGCRTDGNVHFRLRIMTWKSIMQCTVWMKLQQQEEQSVVFTNSPSFFFFFNLVSVGHKRWTDSTMSTGDIGSAFIFFMNESSWKTSKTKFHLQRQNKLPRMYSHA